MDNHTFWNRYFFKIHVLELDKEIVEEAGKLRIEKSNGYFIFNIFTLYLFYLLI